jgi:hypothetical protein
MNVEKEWGVDPQLADEGVWITIDGDGTRIKIAALPNSKWQRHLEVLSRRYHEMDKDIPESSHEEAIASDVLLDWEGLEEGGKPIAPTPENRLAMIRKYQPFLALVIREAKRRANFQRNLEEAEVKN